MGKQPAFQFYPGDWARDLEEHPLEIEGAWIRICCKLWWEETRGIANKSLTNWSRVMRVGERKCKTIIEYLLKHKIADVNIQKDGITITSRRMVKDEHIRQVRIAAGLKGGNPALKTPTENDDLDKQNLVNQNQTPSSSSSISYSKHKTLCVYPEDFEAFYKSYPKHNGKKPAYAEWIKAKDRGELPSIEQITSAIENQKRAKKALLDAGQFAAEWPDPQRWIKNARWDDEIEKPKSGGNGSKPPGTKLKKLSELPDLDKQWAEQCRGGPA